MSKKIISILTIVAILLIIVGTTLLFNKDRIFNVNTFETKQDQTLDNNDWVPIASTKSILEVTYQEKYGLEKTILCKAVFENNKTKEYKCISPELGSLILQKANLNSFKISGSDPK